MDREAWHAAIHGVAKSWTRLSDWTELKLYPIWLRMWELDYKDSWVPKNWCFWTVVLDSWESLGESLISDSATPWSIACQAPLFMGFSRQDYWGGLPCPPPGNLPNPGIKPTFLKSSALAGWFFTSGTNSEDWMLWTQRIGNLLSLSKILCLFNLYVEYITWNAGLKNKLETRLLEEISITSDMQMTSPL